MTPKATRVQGAFEAIEKLLKDISKASRRRARYQEMAAEGLLDLDELRERLAALSAMLAKRLRKNCPPCATRA